MPDDETTPVPQRGALTDRESAIAQGLAVVRGGGSYSEAVEKSGIDRAVLCRAMYRLYCDSGQREAALEASDRRVEAQTATVVELAGDQVIERLSTGQDVPKDLAVIYGVGSDKYFRMRGLDRQQDRDSVNLGEVMQRLADLDLEATVTVKPASRDSRAIDITPHEPHSDP